MEQPRCHQPSPQCPPHHRCHRWPHHAHHGCHNVPPISGSAPCMTSWPASVPPSSPGALVTRTARTPTCAAETPAVTKHTGTSGHSSGSLHLNNLFHFATFKFLKLRYWRAMRGMGDGEEMLQGRSMLWWRGWGPQRWECLERWRLWEQGWDQWSQSDITQCLQTYNYQRVFPRIPWSRYVDRKVIIIPITYRLMSNTIKENPFKSI